MNRFILLFALGLLGFFPTLAFSAETSTSAAPPPNPVFPPLLESYQDEGNPDVWTVVASRALAQPFTWLRR